MAEMLKEPDTPWVAFFKGAGWTAVTVGIPILVGGLFLPESGSYELWTRLGVGGGVAGVMCLVSGVVRAVWALIQRWAYDRVTSAPFH